jgi:nucleoside-diphosphate-sugar epimerase
VHNDSGNSLGRVALFGGGGAIGHVLALELARRSVPYRVVGRTLATLQREFPDADAAVADFLTGDGLDKAAAGIDTVFYLAGAPYTEFYKHPIMVKNALAAAEAAGVKRFVHVAPVYSYGPATVRPVPESQPHLPNTRKGRFRLEQEQAVLDRAGSMRTIVVHLPDFYGPWAELSYANTFIREAMAAKTGSWIGPLAARREFVYVPDVPAPLLELASDEGAYGRCWNIGGTAIVARDFADAVFAAAGKPPKYRSIPKLALQALGLFQPLMREVAEMYYLFDSDFVLDDSALRARLGDVSKTPVRRGLEETADWMRTH